MLGPPKEVYLIFGVTTGRASARGFSNILARQFPVQNYETLFFLLKFESFFIFRLAPSEIERTKSNHDGNNNNNNNNNNNHDNGSPSYSYSYSYSYYFYFP
jgi:hypothetical protein